MVAQMLNAQMIGGKKGDKWRDDIWTMRYLSGFKWEMLGEQIGVFNNTPICPGLICSV
jgi:ESF2/ABP1 family protein